MTKCNFKTILVIIICLNYNSNWKKLLGFRNMQEKLENDFFCANQNAKYYLYWYKIDMKYVHSFISCYSGPHGRVNVMLVRGLFNNFKIPIWYKYDHVLGKKEYLDIVEKLESLGFHVVSTSCDMARSNQKLAKSLGVTEETPYFPNPSRPASNIFWFYDICHLMKLVRNHLIDQGFILRGFLHD